MTDSQGTKERESRMKKILVVIDMQNDFIDGALGTKEAVAIVPKTAEKIRLYPSDCVIATRDTHQINYLQTSEGRHLPVEHCIEGTKGWELREELQKLLTGAVILNKPSFGSLELPETVKRLVGNEEFELELIGLCTDICVVSNALLLKVAFPEVPIRVDAACCAGVTPDSHRAALQTMKMCQIEVIE